MSELLTALHCVTVVTFCVELTSSSRIYSDCDPVRIAHHNQLHQGAHRRWSADGRALATARDDVAKPSRDGRRQACPMARLESYLRQLLSEPELGREQDWSEASAQRQVAQQRHSLDTSQDVDQPDAQSTAIANPHYLIHQPEVEACVAHVAILTCLVAFSLRRA